MRVFREQVTKEDVLIICVALFVLVGVVYGFIAFLGGEKLEEGRCNVDKDCKGKEVCSEKRYCCMNECDLSFCTEDGYHQACVGDPNGCMLLGEKTKKGRLCGVECGQTSDCTHGTYCDQETNTCEKLAEKQVVTFPNAQWVVEGIIREENHLLISVQVNNTRSGSIVIEQKHTRFFDQNKEYKPDLTHEKHSFVYGELNRVQSQQAIITYEVPTDAVQPFYFIIGDRHSKKPDGRENYFVVELTVEEDINEEEVLLT